MGEGVMRRRRAKVNGVELEVTEAGDGEPVILCHGFPEGAYSWRHQLPVLAGAGYHAIAPDQRGYGRSSAPRQVSAYGIHQLTGDLLGLLDETGHDQAAFVGHDWGALIVWDLARLHPERVKAVVGVSVPFVQWPGRPTELMRMLHGDRFFYMLYFQEIGKAEDELEHDTYRTMAKVLWAASGDGFQGPPENPPPMEGTGFLTHLPDPPRPLPGWMSDDDIRHYAQQFDVSGFFGPISYYRNLDANFEVVKDLPLERLSMPCFFIGGDKDPVLVMDPGGIERMRKLLADFRGATIIPGVGHWTQQEDPGAFNDALLTILGSLR
jgi:pimeloyl-ACP methyl ester carboxylesterase